MSEIRVQIWPDYPYGGLKMAISRVVGNDIEVFNLYTREVKKLDRDGICPDEFIMTIPMGIELELFKALAEILDKRGIKTENDHHIAGKIEAQKAHLEDMRKLVFKSR